MKSLKLLIAVVVLLAAAPSWGADFGPVYKNTIRPHEGGWVNNPVDKGKETYRGIARAFWPKWKGWALVDQAKKGLGPQPKYDTPAYWRYVRVLNKRLGAVPGLEDACSDFYQSCFWDQYDIGVVASAALSEDLCDEIVNRGPGGGPPMLAAAFAEIEWSEAKEHLGFKVPVPARYCKKTWLWLNDYTKIRKNRKLVARAFEHYRSTWYLNYLLNHPSQKEYVFAYWQRSID